MFIFFYELSIIIEPRCKVKTHDVSYLLVIIKLYLLSVYYNHNNIELSEIKINSLFSHLRLLNIYIKLTIYKP